MFSIHGFAGANVSPYEKMASPERDKHFVKVIHKGLTVPIDQILRKRGSGRQNQFLVSIPYSLLTS